MTSHDDDLFEQALRADLPSAEQQGRSRKRLLAIGLSAGSGLAATGAASVAQASWSATLVAKVAALSWPATLALAAAVTAPVVALPMWLTPAHPSVLASVVTPAPVRAGKRLRQPTVGEPAGAQPANTGVASNVVTPVVPVAPVAPVAPLRAAEASTASASTPPAVAAFDAVNVGPGLRAPAASTLAAETQLLDRAFAELDAGRDAAAATLIAEHARRYPNGLLRQERERARTRLERNSK